MLRNGIRSVVDWALHYEGSTRSSALIRIGLVILIWISLADWMILFRRRSNQEILFSLLFFLFSALMLVGYKTRFATAALAILLWLGYSRFAVAEADNVWDHHYIYLLISVTTIAIFLPMGRSYSLDRWILINEAVNKGGKVPIERGNLWALRLISLQLSAVYIWSALGKIYSGFLSGIRLEQILAPRYDFLLRGMAPEPISLLVIPSIIIVLFEIVLGVGLHFKVARPYLLVSGVLLHGFFYVLLPVSAFSATMVVLYLSYLDADHLDWVIQRLESQ